MNVRRDAYPYGLLARWPALMDESLYRFFQMAGDGVQVTDTEDATRVYVQYEREQVATALNRAVETMRPYLGFYPRPHYVQNPVMLTVRGDIPWYLQTYQLPFGHLVEFGQRAVTVIDADAAVVYRDTDDDVLDDTASITVTTDVDASEVQVFYRTADGAPSGAHRNWRIEPVTVTDNGDGTVTITGHRALFVSPALWAQPYTNPDYRNPNAGDANQGDGFVTAVDVYRVYTNTTGAVKLISSPRDTSDYEVEVEADIINPVLGTFSLREMDGGSTPVRPRQVRCYARAGYPETEDGLMHPALEQSIVRFANTLMVENPTKSSRTKLLFEHDYQPPGEGEFTMRQAWSPAEFGIKRGALAAWDTVKQMRIETLALIPAEGSGLGRLNR